MSLPNMGNYGIVVNPLVFSVFGEGGNSGSPTPTNSFLLMDGQNFLLMNGQFLVLTGS